MHMSRPRLVTRPKSAASEVSFVAPKPALSGEPGERLAECVGAQVNRRGNKTQLMLTFDIEGQGAPMWVDIPSPLTPACRFMRFVTLALGRPPAAGEPIHPESDGLFRGKRFRVLVGWRKSQDARGKGKFDESLAARRKDSHDFLRVHDLLERLDP
jgi:hypothetical protein